MTALIPRNRYASEEDNRMDWWLREYGRFPTRDALRRIRQYTDDHAGPRRRSRPRQRRVDWD